VADNPYYIAGTECLKNLFGISDEDLLAALENDVTSTRLAKLKVTPLPGKLDYNYFKDIHKNLFDGIYEWAGKERSIPTEKGISRFQWPAQIESSAVKLFNELASENNLKGLGRDDFIKRAAHYCAEFNFVHPFPEGNGRSQRVLFCEIASRADYELDFGRVPKGKFVEGIVHASFGSDISKLEKVFEQSMVDRGR